jgi:hypothetical protein
MIDQLVPRPDCVGGRAPENEGVPIPFHRSTRPKRCYKLPPDQLARFHRWFIAFAGRTNHTAELDSPATKLGRLAGRAFAQLKKRAEP